MQTAGRICGLKYKQGKEGSIPRPEKIMPGMYLLLDYYGSLDV